MEKCTPRLRLCMEDLGLIVTSERSVGLMNGD